MAELPDDGRPAMSDLEKLQLRAWLELEPEERRAAIDLIREISKDGRLDALKRILTDEPKLSALVKTRESFALVGAALMKAIVLVAALGSAALGWERLFGKG